MNQFKSMNDEYLIKNYVPDVYQKNIFSIDYEQLKNAGVKVISFDIDDTIVSIAKHEPTKAAITLFQNLKNDGFDVYIVSNAGEDRVKRFGEKLKAVHISKALKPDVACLEAIRKVYIEKTGTDITPDKMAHVGNSMTRDIAVGKTYGVIACLVRDVGVIPKIGRILNPKDTEGQKLRKVLIERDIWRKHHLKENGDQYYQLGEIPKYLR